MGLPANSILDGIRALRGKARITHPEGNKRTERVATVPREDWELSLLSPDPEHAACLLTDQSKLSEDAKYVEVYRVYDQLPGNARAGSAVSSEHGGGVLTTTTQPVAPGTVVAGGLNIVSASVQPDGAGKSLLQKSELPAGESWPTLHESEWVEQLKEFVTTEKTFVTNNPLVNIPSLVHTDGFYTLTEYKDYDKWKTIRVVSKIPDSAVGKSWTFRQPIQYSIPHEIPEQPDLIKSHVTLTGSPFFSSPAAAANFLESKFSVLNSGLVTGMALDTDIVQGYSGSFSATVTRTISTESSTDEEFKWFPTESSKTFLGTLINSDASRFSESIISLHIPSSIHGAWSFTLANRQTYLGMWVTTGHYTGGVYSQDSRTYYPAGTIPPTPTTTYWGIVPKYGTEPTSWEVPATTPSYVPHGTEIIARVKSEVWRFGLWVNDVYRIIVP